MDRRTHRELPARSRWTHALPSSAIYAVPPTSQTADRAGTAAPLTEAAYYAIRDLIVGLELAPGAVIDERQLTESLGVGRAAVREALRRLAREGLVGVYPRRGAFVAGVDARQLRSLCEVRAAIEPEAARLAAERATVGERHQLQSLLGELERRVGDEEELIVLDGWIHLAIYRAAHNKLLEATLEQYYAMALRIWRLALVRARDLDSACVSRGQLLRAICNGRSRDASSLMLALIRDYEQIMSSALC